MEDREDKKDREDRKIRTAGETGETAAELPALKVRDLMENQVFELIHAGEDTEREITTPFCCDLLSIAMGRAPEGCAWVTVMGNINTLAVAALTDAACIILAEGTSLDEAAEKKAKEQDITVFKTELPVFEGALAVYRLMHRPIHE